MYQICLSASRFRSFIADKISVLDSKIDIEQIALAKYQQLKAGLMQDLLTGKLEVTVAEEILKN